MSDNTETLGDILNRAITAARANAEAKADPQECDCPPGMCLGDAGDEDTSGPFAPRAFEPYTVEVPGIVAPYIHKPLVVAQLAAAAENFSFAFAAIARLAEGLED